MFLVAEIHELRILTANFTELTWNQRSMNPLDLFSVVFLWVSASMDSIDLVCEVKYCSIVFDRRDKVIYDIC